MKGTIITVPVRGPLAVRKVEEEPTVELIKQAIGGGWLETVPYFDSFEVEGELRKCKAFCDEEGKLKKFPFNPRANRAWEQALRLNKRALKDQNGKPYDFLCGDIAVVFGDKQFMDAL